MSSQFQFIQKINQCTSKHVDESQIWIIARVDEYVFFNNLKRSLRMTLHPQKFSLIIFFQFNFFIKNKINHLLRKQYNSHINVATLSIESSLTSNYFKHKSKYHLLQIKISWKLSSHFKDYTMKFQFKFSIKLLIKTW